MTSRDFCFWLQGFFEIGEVKQITAKESEIIQRHLALVFKHEIDPAIEAVSIVTKAELDAIHKPASPAFGPISMHPDAGLIRC